MFINPLRATVVRTSLGDVHIRKGALVSIALEDDALRVSACSGPGDVAIKIGERTIVLAPGEEAMLSTHVPSDEEHLRADGVGRRSSHSLAIDRNLHLTTSEFSIITMLANVEHLKTLSQPTSPVEKRLGDRLLKTAAALQQLTSARGSYTARPNVSHHQTAPHSNVLGI
jgi:hypothetical protein